MRRRLPLLAGLTVAVAIAVLLRTAASEADPIVAAEMVELNTSIAVELATEDCTISPEQEPGLASSEASQLTLLTPLGDIGQVFIASAGSAGTQPGLSFELERPPQLHLLAKVTIRPPPTSHVA